MTVFIGVDPSLNSTGLCMQFYEGDEKIKEYFAIIKPDKLTKKELIAQDTYLFFDYIIYDKFDLKQFDNNHDSEYHKTLNMIAVLDQIIYVIKDNINNVTDIHVVQEGISYGSTIRTKSVFDLAGLNFMIRDRLIKLSKSSIYNFNYIIATPAEIKKWSTGNGNCKKELMIDLFKQIYPDFNLPKIDDICDAYFMASYAKYLNDKNSL
jgi:Holliday junction resolvasome RuvABC endonuclease subunit